MQADFNTPCECCEYRQYVRGGFFVSARPQDPIRRIPHALPGGNMQAAVFMEDGLPAPPPGINVFYGHRNEGNTDPSDQYLPNRANGCRYRGNDFPGLSNVVPPAQGGFALVFRGVIVDTCNGNKEVRSSQWTVSCLQPAPAAAARANAIASTITVDPDFANECMVTKEAVVVSTLPDGSPITLDLTMCSQDMTVLAATVSIANGDGSASVFSSDVTLGITDLSSGTGLSILAQPSGELPQTAAASGGSAHAVYDFSAPAGNSVHVSLSFRGAAFEFDATLQ